MKIQEEGKTISLSELTASDEERLRDLSLKRKEEYPGFSIGNALETSLEVGGTDGVEIVVEFLCSNCAERVGAIANWWPLCLFKKIKGYYCRSSSCEFYRKFIPVSKSSDLLFVASLPIVQATLEDTGGLPHKDI
jgi:hypothetical protein